VHGCASYLIGSSRAEQVLVVDPLEAVGADEYVLAAADAGMSVARIVETHVHADHVSAAQRLSALTGAPVGYGRGAAVRFPHQELADGERLVLGELEFEVLATPGHTPESISLLCRDADRDGEAWFLLSGDALFSGDVGRPDLAVGSDVRWAREQAGRLYDSLHDRILGLGDWVEVYPAHYGASACGGAHMSGKPISTIGFERRTNPALRQRGRQAFVDFVLASLKAPPADAAGTVARNRGEPVRPEVR
jgi:hydroxyacylglutathione hydrolase